MNMRRTWLWALVVLAPAVELRAQADSLKLPPAVRLTREREIALAKTAAPASVSDSAEIWVLGDRGFEKVVEGRNGYGCIVQRGLGGQSEIPRCDDASGVMALFPVYQFIEKMRHEGRTFGEARRAIEDGFKSGRFKQPRFGGFSYMYSIDAVFVTATGERIAFTPHVMVYWPGCDVKQLGMSARTQMRGTALGFVDYGTPECTLIINTPPSTARRVGDGQR
jgi:hypothetical protein